MSIYHEQLAPFFTMLGKGDMERGVDLYRYGIWTLPTNLLTVRIGSANYDVPGDVEEVTGYGHPLARERVAASVYMAPTQYDDPSLAAYLAPIHKFHEHEGSLQNYMGSYRRFYLQGEICSMVNTVLAIARNSLITSVQFFGIFHPQTGSRVLIGEKMHIVNLQDLTGEVEPGGGAATEETDEPGEVILPGDQVPFVIEYHDKCSLFADVELMGQRESYVTGRRGTQGGEFSQAKKRTLAQYQRYLEDLLAYFQQPNVFGFSDYPVTMIEVWGFGDPMDSDIPYREYVETMEVPGALDPTVEDDDTPF